MYMIFRRSTPHQVLKTGRILPDISNERNSKQGRQKIKQAEQSKPGRADRAGKAGRRTGQADVMNNLKFWFVIVFFCNGLGGSIRVGNAR